MGTKLTVRQKTITRKSDLAGISERQFHQQKHKSSAPTDLVMGTDVENSPWQCACAPAAIPSGHRVRSCLHGKQLTFFAYVRVDLEVLKLIHKEEKSRDVKKDV